MLTLAHFLSLGAILFCLSVAGIFLNRKNVIILLMCIELMLLAVNMNFVAFSRFHTDRGCGRSSHWPGYPGRVVPQPRDDQRGRTG